MKLQSAFLEKSDWYCLLVVDYHFDKMDSLEELQDLLLFTCQLTHDHG